MSQYISNDPILSINVVYKADPSTDKLNLGVGAYRTGSPRVLNVVRKVEQLVANDVSLNKEYLPIEGLPDFTVATVQALSGTGALRTGAEFLARFAPCGAASPILLGIAIDRSYYKEQTRYLNFEGFIGDLKAAPNGSVFILHTCAHNLTGVDPTLKQWEAILDVIASLHILSSMGGVPFLTC